MKSDSTAASYQILSKGSVTYRGWVSGSTIESINQSLDADNFLLASLKKMKLFDCRECCGKQPTRSAYRERPPPRFDLFIDQSKSVDQFLIANSEYLFRSKAIKCPLRVQGSNDGCP